MFLRRKKKCLWLPKVKYPFLNVCQILVIQGWQRDGWASGSIHAKKNKIHKINLSQLLSRYHVPSEFVEGTLYKLWCHTHSHQPYTPLGLYNISLRVLIESISTFSHLSPPTSLFLTPSYWASENASEMKIGKKNWISYEEPELVG